MNTIDLLLAQNKNFKFIGVNFTTFYSDSTKPLKAGKTYYYKTTEDFEIGDDAVVDVHGELKIVRITELDCMLDINTNIKYKWIVSKVDKTEYERCQEVEKELTCQINTIRVNQLRKECLKEIKEELGSAEVKKLVKL